MSMFCKQQKLFSRGGKHLDMKKNVLIFPAGTEIAFEIVNALKYSKFVHLIGGTSVNDHSEFVYSDLIKGFPYVNDPDFLDYLNNVIEQYAVDSIFPAHDSVCLFMSQHKEEIHAQVIITDPMTTSICRSKKETYRFFAKEGFVPQIYQNVCEIDSYPVFVKPSVGQGSQGAKTIRNEMELQNALSDDSTLIICEYLPGVEYTVDCFTDRHGVLRICKLRDRQRIRAGIAVRSSVLNADLRVQKIAETINRQLHFRGAWFFQLKKNAAEEYRLMEISPRVPGTMGISRNCGINFPMLTLFDFWGYEVEIVDNGYEITVDRAFSNAYRVSVEYEHIYLDYDDTLIIDGAVNEYLMMYLYQARSKGKQIHLLSKHIGDIEQDFDRFAISKALFDDIIIIPTNMDKSAFVTEAKAIFIDDSFAERLIISRTKQIPVFDVDMIECLMDWRR